jgi:hypothetical protein
MQIEFSREFAKDAISISARRNFFSNADVSMRWPPAKHFAPRTSTEQGMQMQTNANEHSAKRLASLHASPDFPSKPQAEGSRNVGGTRNRRTRDRLDVPVFSLQNPFPVLDNSHSPKQKDVNIHRNQKARQDWSSRRRGAPYGEEKCLFLSLNGKAAEQINHHDPLKACENVHGHIWRDSFLAVLYPAEAADTASYFLIASMSSFRV